MNITIKSRKIESLDFSDYRQFLLASGSGIRRFIKYRYPEMIYGREDSNNMVAEIFGNAEYSHFPLTEREISRLLYHTKPDNQTSVVGFGGGKILDAAKHVSGILDIPCILIPSILSTDSFLMESAAVRYTDRPFIGYKKYKRPITTVLDLKFLEKQGTTLGWFEILSHYTAMLDMTLRYERGPGNMNPEVVLDFIKYIEEGNNTIGHLSNAFLHSANLQDKYGDSCQDGPEHLLANYYEVCEFYNLFGTKVGGEQFQVKKIPAHGELLGMGQRIVLRYMEPYCKKQLGFSAVGKYEELLKHLRIKEQFSHTIEGDFNPADLHSFALGRKGVRLNGVLSVMSNNRGMI